MSEEFFNHYINGGVFTARYTPKVTSDLSVHNKSMINQLIGCHQNSVIVPGGNRPDKYPGQHMFSSQDIDGYFPEEDIRLLSIHRNHFIDFPEKLPVYLYKMHYTEISQIAPNFGKDFRPELPFIVSRSYSTKMDDYVVNQLSSPKATLVERAIYRGVYQEEIKFITIYHAA